MRTLTELCENSIGIFKAEISAKSKLEGTCHEVIPGFGFCPVLSSMTSKAQNVEWPSLYMEIKIRSKPRAL